MKLIVLLFLMPLFFAGCKEVSFKEPQPKGKSPLTSIPKKLQGKYLTEDEGGRSKDTVILTANGFYFGYFDPSERAKKKDEYKEGLLGDSLVLKYYKGYYFFNRNDRPEWFLRVVEQEKNGDLTVMSMDDPKMEFNAYLEKLSVEIAIDSVQTESETLYQIDPSPAKLVELIEKGFFAKNRLIKVK
jgi:hypothetical protein